MNIHHIAVQVRDLDNSINWYRDYFDMKVKWTLDQFSELTTSRLPGITKIAELGNGNFNFHLFHRTPLHDVSGDRVQFQHVCIQVPQLETLVNLRAKCVELHSSQKYEYYHDEGPTDVVIDENQISSFYMLDPNGNEFEFTHIP